MKKSTDTMKKKKTDYSSLKMVMKDEDGDELMIRWRTALNLWFMMNWWWWRLKKGTALNEGFLKLLLQLGFQMKGTTLNLKLGFVMPHFNFFFKIINRIPGIRIYKNGIRIRPGIRIYKSGTRSGIYGFGNSA